MENDKYKGMLSKCYKGEKINELISLDKQIKELQEKRRNLSREIERDTIGINISEFPICGFLYYDTWETKLVKNSNNYWSAAHRKRTGKRIQDVSLKITRRPKKKIDKIKFDKLMNRITK